MTAYSSITKGLEEALDFAKGKTENARIHQIDVPQVDIVALRKKAGLSQAQFAKSIGVAKGTLLNWEQGRRLPSGPAQVLLALIAKKPALVQEILE